MNLRTHVEETVERLLKEAVTLAGPRVYIERTRDIDLKGDDKPPMICIYFSKMGYKREGGTHTRWVLNTMFYLECWAEVDPSAASRVLGDPDRIQAKALDALTQQAVNALIKSTDFLRLFSEQPSIDIEFGQDINSQKRVGVSCVTFTTIDKGQVPYDETVEYDDLKVIWTDTEVRDSPGKTPDVPAISEHPDMQAQVTGLDEE